MGFGAGSFKKLKLAAAVLSGTLAAGYTLGLVSNFVVHNYTEQADNFVMVSSSNWRLGYTKYSCSVSPKNGTLQDEVVTGNLFHAPTRIIDGGQYGERDGHADRIAFGEGYGALGLDAKKDYAKSRGTFDAADRSLAQAKEMFARELMPWQVREVQISYARTLDVLINERNQDIKKVNEATTHAELASAREIVLAYKRSVDAITQIAGAQDNFGKILALQKLKDNAGCDYQEWSDETDRCKKTLIKKLDKQALADNKITTSSAK